MNSHFEFPTELGQQVFREKYANGPDDTWPNLARRVVEDVCGPKDGAEAPLMSKSDRADLIQAITEMKFIPGGRYLVYAGRPLSFYQSCFALRCEEDTREEWANVMWRAISCLMSGGGIGVDYSRLRPGGYPLKRTGGISSGPLSLMQMINDAGRGVMQGGNRRSAIWAGLSSEHEDIVEFIYKKAGEQGVLDFTNTSVLFNYDDVYDIDDHVWLMSVEQACRTGEPGHAYNFGSNIEETLRNACTEFTSDTDSDVCNLGSLNFANIKSIDELEGITRLASMFLVCGSIRGTVPYEKVAKVRNENRKIGLGIMGIHEWLLQRSLSYVVTDELHAWLMVYRRESERAATEHAHRFYLATPKKFRAIAPAGTIGILAGTTQGIEPLFSVAYKRRYLSGGQTWNTQFVIEPVAASLVYQGLDPETIETAFTIPLSQRLQFQANVQAYVDMGISSTINIPAWGSDANNEDTVKAVSDALLYYAGDLRGVTLYPNGARSGQPIEPVSLQEAKDKHGIIFTDDSLACATGVCGV